MSIHVSPKHNLSTKNKLTIWPLHQEQIYNLKLQIGYILQIFK
jgi:hypothetical protein